MSLEGSFMSSESGKVLSKSSQTGYSASEVASFMEKGDLAASNIKSSGLTKKKRTLTETGTSDKFLGGFETIKDRKVSASGFGGAFANKSDAEIKKLINVFEKRRNLISERRRAPGASQTRLLG